MLSKKEITAMENRLLEMYTSEDTIGHKRLLTKLQEENQKESEHAQINVPARWSVAPHV